MLDGSRPACRPTISSWPARCSGVRRPRTRSAQPVAAERVESGLAGPELVVTGPGVRGGADEELELPCVPVVLVAGEEGWSLVDPDCVPPVPLHPVTARAVARTTSDGRRGARMSLTVTPASPGRRPLTHWRRACQVGGALKCTRPMSAAPSTHGGPVARLRSLAPAVPPARSLLASGRRWPTRRRTAAADDGAQPGRWSRRASSRSGFRRRGRAAPREVA